MGGPPTPLSTKSVQNEDSSIYFSQVDGNVSIISSPEKNELLNDRTPISVIFGYRPPKIILERPPHSRRILRRSNKAIQALALPKIACYNMRSLFPKILNFSLDMRERQTNIGFLTEVWEKKEKKKHQFRLEEMLEMSGVKYISTPRPGAQRGGGAAIVAGTDKFSISKLNIPIPKSVEVVWGLLKPKVMTGKISTIIVCCFYSPPRSRKNPELLAHLTNTLQSLLIIHPEAGVIISGDRNNIEISRLLLIDSSLRQIVKQNTREQKILDVILTNLHCFYDAPEIVPPITPDIAGKGVPSDHSGVIASPHTNSTLPTKTQKLKKNIRPIPESLLLAFGQKLEVTDFSSVYMQENSTNMVDMFQNKMSKLVEETFPLKSIIISNEDQVWFNEDLRAIKRARLREYNRHGKTQKYQDLKSKFDTKFRQEFFRYKAKIEMEVKEGKRGSSYSVIKKLGLRPGEVSHPEFILPEHAVNNISPARSAEILADYFSAVSQEYEPLDVANLPPNIQAYLSTNDGTDPAPFLSIAAVYQKLVKSRKPNSSVPGDLPKKVVMQYAANLAKPVSIIYNHITNTSVYPQQWKHEHQIPVPKVYPPQSEDDIRNISKTAFLSKCYESFLAEWLLPIIQPFLDPGQCGIKGLSITHYLIRLLHFVHSAWDKRTPHAVLAACVDLSKAFNRIDHSLVIQDLFDMHTPAWLLKIIVSYLSGRSMTLKHRGEESKLKPLPGGGPQGAYLGGIIFIVKFNGAFLRPPVPRNTLGVMPKSKSKSVKFVDDGSIAVSINLKTSLIPAMGTENRPLNYHERTCQVLPYENNLLQWIIEDTEQFTIHNKMKVNPKKTKIILFNKSRKHDFPPKLHFSDGDILEVVSHIKLVGVILSNDMRWKQNTDYICQKANKKLWILRRLKQYELDPFNIFDVYCKEVRSLLELAVPVWHSGLTKAESKQIESIQKTAFKIILGPDYIDYEVACTIFGVEPLELRRVQLCLKFAKKDLKKPNTIFTKIQKTSQTRSVPKLVKEHQCRTSRFEKSSIPYLSKLLNA